MVAMRVLGLDPGLRRTGWGVIESDGNRLRHVAHGVVRSRATAELAERLKQLFIGLRQVIDTYAPNSAAVEKTFINGNGASSLGLGQARAVALLAPALEGLPVAEYAANLVKQSITGRGHAQKSQVAAMIAVLLPGTAGVSDDAADALAVAVCHAHHAAGLQRLRVEA